MSRRRRWRAPGSTATSLPDAAAWATLGAQRLNRRQQLAARQPVCRRLCGRWALGDRTVLAGRAGRAAHGDAWRAAAELGRRTRDARQPSRSCVARRRLVMQCVQALPWRGRRAAFCDACGGSSTLATRACRCWGSVESKVHDSRSRPWQRCWAAGRRAGPIGPRATAAQLVDGRRDVMQSRRKRLRPVAMLDAVVGVVAPSLCRRDAAAAPRLAPAARLVECCARRRPGVRCLFADAGRPAHGGNLLCSATDQASARALLCCSSRGRRKATARMEQLATR
jgi:hypothetical protein